MSTEVSGGLAISKGDDSKNAKVRRSKSLFSVTNGQTLRSQISDLALVIRWMVYTTYRSPTSMKFAFDHIINPRTRNDRFVVSFGLPALSDTPRILSQAPSIRSGLSNWTFHGQRTACMKEQILNVASYNYLGFVDINEHDHRLLESAIRTLPLTEDGLRCDKGLEREVENQLRQYFGMHGCVLTASGYSINLVAFPAIALNSMDTQVEALGTSPIFVIDSESHSSMFLGARIACAQSGGRIIKFTHNNLEHLACVLEGLALARPRGIKDLSPHVWVCVEGLYSMDGTVPPIDEIVRLKLIYGFHIYIDEAHSLLSLGRTGRGVVEHYSDTTEMMPSAFRIHHGDIDMIGGTLSKSFSSVGGFVLFSPNLEHSIRARVQLMKRSGISSIPVMSLIRTLQILKAPHVIADRISRLQQISSYVASQLRTKGYSVSTTPGGPFIALILDNVSQVLEFLRFGRKLGLLCCGAAYPVAPRGMPRIRLSLTGAHTWRDVNDILQLIDEISAKIGVRKISLTKASTPPADMTTERRIKAADNPIDDVCKIEDSSEAMNLGIARLCPQSIADVTSKDACIRNAAADALRTYGLGAAGPRWMCGTTSAHMSLERLLNSVVCHFLPEVGSTRSTNPASTTLFTDASVGLLSLIFVSMESLTPRRVKKGEQQLVFLPENASAEVREGVCASNQHESTTIHWYHCPGAEYNESFDRVASSMVDLVRTATRRSTRLHSTVYVDTAFCGVSNEVTSIEETQLYKHLFAILAPFQTQKFKTLTLLINDGQAFATSFTNTQRILVTLRHIFPDVFVSNKVRWLIFASFTTLPQISGIQGAFATGSRNLVENIQFLGPGVMYTAMMPSINAVLAEESIRQVISCSSDLLAATRS